jgi:hypothetical protein
LPSKVARQRLKGTSMIGICHGEIRGRSGTGIRDRDQGQEIRDEIRDRGKTQQTFI